MTGSPTHGTARFTLRPVRARIALVVEPHDPGRAIFTGPLDPASETQLVGVRVAADGAWMLLNC